MNGKRTKKWWRWQRGQAMAEYWVTIPVGIIIMLAASGLAQFVTGGLTQTVEGLQNPGGLTCEVTPDEADEGPDYAQLDCHSVQLVSKSYDEATDQTTLAYQVTSACDPAISHWILGLPPGVAKNIISSSEPYIEHLDTPDPTTGAYGIKFDTGYDEGGGGGGGGGKGKGKKSADTIMLVGLNQSTSPTESRTIFLTLGGYYEWEIVEVHVKAGTEHYESVITAPVSAADPSDTAEDECGL